MARRAFQRQALVRRYHLVGRARCTSRIAKVGPLASPQNIGRLSNICCFCMQDACYR